MQNRLVEDRTVFLLWELEFRLVWGLCHNLSQKGSLKVKNPFSGCF